MKRRAIRGARRGYTLGEVALAGSMLIVVMSGAVGILSTAGRMQSTTQLRTEAGQDTSIALSNIVQDLREATSVTLPNAYTMRIYYPQVAADGYYDKFRQDDVNYVEYRRAASNGAGSASGTYLYRVTPAGSSRRMCDNLTNFAASLVTNNSVQLTLRVRRTAGSRYSEVTLNQKVVFLRNH